MGLKSQRFCKPKILNVDGANVWRPDGATFRSFEHVNVRQFSIWLRGWTHNGTSTRSHARGNLEVERCRGPKTRRFGSSVARRSAAQASGSWFAVSSATANSDRIVSLRVLGFMKMRRLAKRGFVTSMSKVFSDSDA